MCVCVCVWGGGGSQSSDKPKMHCSSIVAVTVIPVNLFWSLNEHASITDHFHGLASFGAVLDICCKDNQKCFARMHDFV